MNNRKSGFVLFLIIIILIAALIFIAREFSETKNQSALDSATFPTPLIKVSLVT